ncbi:MAG: GPW/gp25 family protein [Cyanobacteria bacterium P01_D01_bin.44]
MSSSQVSPNQLSQDDSFLGTGWTFPPRFTRLSPHQGQVEMVSAEADILQSLQIILSTQPGERLMLPDFGCELSQFVFEEIQQGVVTSIRGIVADALLYHEPRIQVDRIDVDTRQAIEGLLLISIDYTVRQTNTRSNMVYPFYIKEATYV